MASARADSLTPTYTDWREFTDHTCKGSKRYSLLISYSTHFSVNKITVFLKVSFSHSTFRQVKKHFITIWIFTWMCQKCMQECSNTLQTQADRDGVPFKPEHAAWCNRPPHGQLASCTNLCPSSDRELGNLHCVSIHHKYFTTDCILVLTKFLDRSFKVFVVWKLKRQIKIP